MYDVKLHQIRAKLHYTLLPPANQLHKFVGGLPPTDRLVTLASRASREQVVQITPVYNNISVLTF